MAARKKVRANSKAQAQASQMPPEMQRAMFGGAPPRQTQRGQQGPQLPRNTAAQAWMETLASPEDPNALYQYPYEHPTDPAKNRIAYFRRENAMERNAYIMDFAEERLTLGALKVVFLRLRDEHGERVFTDAEQYQWLLKNGAGTELEAIGTAIYGYERESDLEMEDAKNASDSTETTN